MDVRPKVIVAVKRDSAEPRVLGNLTEGIEPYYSANYFRKPKMNERIEHLAEKATKEMDQEAFSEDMNIPAEWYQKFAELIVRECAKVAMRSVSDDEPKEAWYLIQEHFGVKE